MENPLLTSTHVDRSVVRAVKFVFAQHEDYEAALDALGESDMRAAELLPMLQAFVSGLVTAGMRSAAELKVNAMVYGAELRRDMDVRAAA